MNLSPDQTIYWQHGIVKLNATLVFTWLLMAVLVAGAALLARGLRDGAKLTRRQCALEILVEGLLAQIAGIGLRTPRTYLPFLGTLFLFTAASALSSALPGFAPPTSALSTTVALAACVFFAVPWFGILGQGVRGYLRAYVEPTLIMLPFNLISEGSRTLALAVRLFGNMMSGSMIVGILLTITPFIFPVVMTALGLLTGLVQAYIFTILAAVYIAAATRDTAADPPAPAASGPNPPGKTPWTAPPSSP